MTTKTRMTLEEYLALPETKPYKEFLNGEVLEKMAPDKYHSAGQGEFIFRLRMYFQECPEAVVRPELRFLDSESGQAYLPDLAVVLKERYLQSPRGRAVPIPFPPDIAIEILSRDDSASDVLARVEFLLRAGVKLIWIVDPTYRTITVYRPDHTHTVLNESDVLDAQPVLSNFLLPLSDFWAEIDEVE